MRERSVGLGVMGFHSFLQAEQHPARIGDGQGVEQEDVQAHPRPVRRRLEDAGRRSAAPARTRPISASRSASPTSSRSRRPRRSRSSAAAPRPASSRRRPTSTTTRRCRARFVVRNPYLEKLLAQKGRNDEDTWTSITINQGSVQHLDFLDDHEKAVFKTAFEIDQRWLIEHAADRTPYHLPEPVAQRLPAGRRAQARPAPDPHDGVEARREEPLLLPLALASSAPRSCPATRYAGRSATRPFQPPELTPDVPSLPPARRRHRRVNDYEECLSCQ